MSVTDPYGLERFRTAQGRIFETALAELLRGQKQTHWMWFVFPQLGVSASRRPPSSTVSPQSKRRALILPIQS